MNHTLTIIPVDQLIAFTSPDTQGATLPLVMTQEKAKPILTFWAERIQEGNATVIETTNERTVISQGKGAYQSRVIIEWATEAQILHAYERGNVRC